MRVSIPYAIAGILITLTGATWADLVSNGNFESGGGFRTEYLRSDDLTASGTVVVGYDPCDHHPLAASYGDHTSGLGRMLIANGSTSGRRRRVGADRLGRSEHRVCILLLAFHLDRLHHPADADPMPDRRRPRRPRGLHLAGGGGLDLRPDPVEIRVRLAGEHPARGPHGHVENNDFALDDIGMITTGGNYVLMTSSTLGRLGRVPGRGGFPLSAGRDGHPRSQVRARLRVRRLVGGVLRSRRQDLGRDGHGSRRDGRLSQDWTIP